MQTTADRTTIMGLQSSRAYQAARTGMEWAGWRAVNSLPCNSASPLVLDGFSVTVSCSSATFQEGSNNYQVFDIVSQAEYGSYGQEDYVFRRIQGQISLH